MDLLSRMMRNLIFSSMQKRVLGSKFEQLKICEEVEYLEEDTYKGKQAVDVVIK